MEHFWDTVIVLIKTKMHIPFILGFLLHLQSHDKNKNMDLGDIGDNFPVQIMK